MLKTGLGNLSTPQYIVSILVIFNQWIWDFNRMQEIARSKYTSRISILIVSRKFIQILTVSKQSHFTCVSSSCVSSDASSDFFSRLLGFRFFQKKRSFVVFKLWLVVFTVAIVGSAIRQCSVLYLEIDAS